MLSELIAVGLDSPGVHQGFLDPKGSSWEGGKEVTSKTSNGRSRTWSRGTVNEGKEQKWTERIGLLSIWVSFSLFMNFILFCI